MEEIKTIIINKMKTKSANSLSMRMILSGKNRNNNHMVFSYDSSTDIEESSGKIESDSFYTQIAVPRSDKKLIDIVNNHINEGMSSRDIDILGEHVRCAIREIAKIEITVNEHIDGYVIF